MLQSKVGMTTRVNWYTFKACPKVYHLKSQFIFWTYRKGDRGWKAWLDATQRLLNAHPCY